MSSFKFEKTGTNEVTFEISFEKAVFDAAVEKVYRKEVKNINIPGFRKGKAPKSIIEKMYGKAVFFDDAINDLIPEAYENAVAESKVAVVSRPEVDVKSIDENGLVITAKVTTKPEIAIADYIGISAPKNVTVASDEDVDNEVKTVRERTSREIEISDDTAAVNGDIAKIDFEGFVNDVAFEGGKGENYSLKLGSGTFIPGFEDQIIGHKIGDEFDVNVTFPTEYGSDELAGKAAVFKCRLNALTHVELPELDDDFAKDVSEFDTVAEYLADVKAKIQKRYDANAEREFENAILDKLVEKVEGEIPAVMFDNEVENIVRDYDNQLRQNGMQLDMYLKYMGKTLDELKADVRPQSEKQVKLRLALEKVAELENITADENEINEEIEKLAKAYGMEVEQIKSFVSNESVAEDIKTRKAMDLVKEKAVVAD